MKSNRLAIVCTHPIQYYVPVYRNLAARPDLEVRVFYGHRGATQTAVDHGFGQSFAWDIPLLDGYEFEFVDNVSPDPGSHHFKGIDCPGLIPAIENWGATSVLIYGWSYRSHLQALRHFHRRIPVLFRGDSTLLDDRPGLRQLARRWYLSRIYRNIDVALYVGTNNKRYFESLGLRPSQLTFAPHAIDNTRFQNTGSNGSPNADSRTIRQQLGIRDDQTVFAFVGKLEPKKAPDLLVAACQKLPTKDHALVLIGAGELESELKKAAGENVHFVGFKNQTELPDWYRAADVIVLPSRGPGETWGLALNEAMACSRAVIASDKVGAAIDLIQNGENGWICKANDQESLSECIATAARIGRDRLLQMGRKSKEIIECWSIDRQAQAIAEATTAVTKPTR